MGKAFGSGCRSPGFQMSDLNLAGPQFLSLNWNPKGWCAHKCTDTSKALGTWGATITTVLIHQTPRADPAGIPKPSSPQNTGAVQVLSFSPLPKPASVTGL